MDARIVWWRVHRRWLCFSQNSYFPWVSQQKLLSTKDHLGFASKNHGLQNPQASGEKALFHCAEKGFVTEWAGGTVPLRGASGGGCPSGQQSTSVEYSTGGGLLWLSTPVLFLNTSVRLKADGLQGTVLGKRLGMSKLPELKSGFVYYLQDSLSLNLKHLKL